jgi:RNA polymerase sigma factor (sigma-70 family)
MDYRTNGHAWDGLENLRAGITESLSFMCRDENTVADVVQESLLKAARYRLGLKDGRKLRAWTMSIAHNTFRDHMRSKHWEDTCEKYEELIHLTEGQEPIPGENEEEVRLPAIGTVLGRREAIGHLYGALNELGSEDRELLRAFYWGAGTCTDAAAECGLTPTLTKSRLFRARRRLRKHMERRLALEGIYHKHKDTQPRD